MRLVKNIIFRARLHEQQPAIAFGGGIATYAILMHSVIAVVEALQILSLPKGGAVVIDIRNPVHHTATMFALSLLGHPSASVSSAQIIHETGLRPVLFLTDRDDLNDPTLPIRKVDPRWFTVDLTAPVNYERLMSLPGFSRPDEIVRYVYSSGTTGRPKCIALTQEQMEIRLANFTLNVPQMLSGGPWLTMMGFSTGVGYMYSLIVHSAGILHCFASNYVEALQMIRFFQVASVTVATIQLQGLLQSLGDQPPPPSLRAVGVTGSKLPLSLLNDGRARLSSHIFGAYGATEMGTLSIASPAELAEDEGAAGRIVPWVEIELVDESGKAVPPGAEGILRVRSPEQALYVDDHGNAVASAPTGWFTSGDVGRMGPGRRLFITGRSSEIINRGGVVVAPDFVEDSIRLDPRVEDVCVVGNPTASGVDEIWAAVVAKMELDPQDLAGSVRLRLQERSPDRYFVVEKIPRNENGKVMRNVLRETLRARA